MRPARYPAAARGAYRAPIKANSERTQTIGDTTEEPTVKKMNRLPHEEKTADGLPVEGEGVRSPNAQDDDVQAHSAETGPEGVGTKLPGTGGDYRRPSGGGEVTDDDVEGHVRNI